MTPWTISEFQEWLKDKEKRLKSTLIAGGETERIVTLIFQILQAELQHEFENDREAVEKCRK